MLVVNKTNSKTTVEDIVIEIKKIVENLFYDRERNLIGEDYLGYKDKGAIKKYVTANVKKIIKELD